ncbi:family 43 glycosylhydrolase [Seonamhaeicola sp. ML3]|uniref:family 43 glycosylhydrolase n=1 Tax=Seonamhaeicola sp. ML3 TaxID=2937786 RepID=UPI002010A183|nr:family 43 glycosylhydrolase [Seonamhaeicola sp. ML3]
MKFFKSTLSILILIALCFVNNFSCKNSASKIASQTENTETEKPFKEGNPLVKNVGMADPHIRIFNNKAYLYATRDEDKTAKKFVMPDWKIWSSDDLVHWDLERTIEPTETYMGKSKRCWATDAAYKNGKYYFYFSNGNTDTGVMVGNTPTGPFKDALGKPMLPEDLTPIKEYDPSVLVDDDNEAYIVFGHHRSNHPDFYYMIAKLSEDMISLAETPKEVKIIGDAKVLGGSDKPTLHKRNGIFYLSAGSHYATSKNIYGPYTKVGNSGNSNYGLDGKAHGNYFDWNDQSFHTWCHFHLGKDVARYRESYISYLHYKDNGEMVTDTNFLDKHFAMGVGQYDANWDKIEAEWYMRSTRTEKKDGLNNGFVIKNIAEDGSISFPNLYNLKDKKSIKFNVLSLNGGKIEVKSGEGKIIGLCEVEKTETYTITSCDLSNLEDVKSFVLSFKGEVFLDWFSIN